MASQFPAQHTTSTSAPPTDRSRTVHLNKSYIHTMDGRLKLVHLVLSVVVFICTMVSHYPRSPPANWMSFVSMSSFWTSAVLLFLHVINVTGSLTLVPWLTVEVVYSGIWTFFWMVTGAVAADYAARGAGDAFAVASFFSFLTMFVYGFTTFLHYKAWRDAGNQVSLGFRSGASSTATATSTTTTTTTTTATTQKY